MEEVICRLDGDEGLSDDGLDAFGCHVADLIVIVMGWAMAVFVAVYVTASFSGAVIFLQ